MKYLDGIIVRDNIISNLENKCNDLNLIIIQVEDNKESNIYIRNKLNVAKKIGIDAKLVKLMNTSNEEILGIIDGLNKDSSINGIIVQLPLPNYLDKKMILNSISINKDVDGLRDDNIKMSATANAIMKLFSFYKIKLSDKKITIIGNGNVGKPLYDIMKNSNLNVYSCDSKSNISTFTIDSDIIILASGKRNLINSDIIKDKVIIIDVGYHFIDGKSIGDVDYELIKDKVSLISPVPGGIGPITTAMIYENLYYLHK